MHIMVFASQKGGVGKTTLAAHVAVAAEAAGLGPVVLIDMDPQGSMADWWNVRQAETPAFAQVELSGLAASLERLAASGVGLVVIDTPPALSEAIKGVAQLADLIVIPSRPSPLDLRAVAGTVDMLAPLGRPMVFVITCATHRARLTNEAVFALAQHGKLAPVAIGNRVDFASSMIDGRTVGELDSSCKSAAEINQLITYLTKQLYVDVRPIEKGETA